MGMDAPSFWSPVAVPVAVPRVVTARKEPTPWGVCVHTTGSGVPTQAARLGEDPLATALRIYLAPDDPGRGLYTNFPHYVIAGDGRVAQLASEALRARHVGIPPEDRDAYRSGRWRSAVSALGLSLWDQRWPGRKTPTNLYPSTIPNEDFLGVELIPSAAPLAGGSRFTPQQYSALGWLLEDVEHRHGLVLEGTRILGHEDLSPLTRWDRGGGWDPGSLRHAPSFAWHEVRRATGIAFVV